MSAWPHPQPEHVPKTRRELFAYLWNKGRTECNLVKEGPFYAAIVGREIRATHVRCIDSMTCAQWEAAHFYPRTGPTRPLPNF